MPRLRPSWHSLIPDLCTALLAFFRPPPAVMHPSVSCPSGVMSWLQPACLCKWQCNIWWCWRSVVFICLRHIALETGTKDPYVKGLTEFNRWILRKTYRSCSSDQSKYVSLLYARGAPGDMFQNTRWFPQEIVLPMAQCVMAIILAGS